MLSIKLVIKLVALLIECAPKIVFVLIVMLQQKDKNNGKHFIIVMRKHYMSKKKTKTNKLIMTIKTKTTLVRLCLLITLIKCLMGHKAVRVVLVFLGVQIS